MHAPVQALIPDWPAPPGVGAAMSTRLGGVSTGAYASLNLRPPALGGGDGEDDPQAVRANLQRWREAIGAEPVYLRQVHGAEVVRLNTPAEPGAFCADAAVTTEPGLACTVLVADCLPVLFCDRQGRAVAAAHAGWRGLAAGVLEHTVRALQEAAGCEASEVLAWLGPCIGPQAFEVGADVLTAFGASADEPRGGSHPSPSQARFAWAPRPDGTPRWHADLAGLAADRLAAIGVSGISACGRCTVSDALSFFSFRRASHDGSAGRTGRTGRMAVSIWRQG